MSPATIRDVARRAGVGVGTVSRVVNGGRNVSVATSQRIQAAIEELGYLPDVRARALARGRTSGVTVLVPFVTHPSAVERVTGLVEGFRRSGLPISIADVESPEHQHRHLATVAGDLRPEGLVVVSLRLTDAELAVLAEAGIRPVLIDTEAEGLTSLVVDDQAGGRLATGHLLSLGHRRIAFVGDLEDNRFGFVSSRLRHQGYLDALAAAGVPRRPEYERTGHHGQDTARGQALELMSTAQPPTAVFAASDTQALGVLEAAHDLGLVVPRDLSVIGFDDTSVASFTGLTTIHQPLVDSGRQAALAVMRQLNDPGSPPEHVVLPTHLVERRTTAPPSEHRARGDTPT